MKSNVPIAVTCLIALHATFASAQSRDASEMFKRFDRNGNGAIDPEEVAGPAKGYFAKAAEQAGLDPSKPLPIEKLVEASKGERSEKKSEERRQSPKLSARPVLSGFGSEAKPPETPPTFEATSTSLNLPSEEAYDKRVIEHIDEETLKKYDRNRNGILEFSEMEDGKWNPSPQDSDLNHDGRLTRDELRERYAKKFNLPPKVAGSSTTTATGGDKSSSSSGSSSGSKSSGDAQRVREYAQGLLNRYDKNKSGFLEKDEWSDMKSEHHAADVNKDGVITLDELAAKIGGFANAPTTSSSPPSTGATAGKPSATRKWWQSNSASNSSKPSEKKSYRALSPTERLPKGLPDWFARNDADADGQVMMAEYAAAWTEAAAAEFAKYDLDSDGVITPEECLAAEKEKTKKK